MDERVNALVDEYKSLKDLPNLKRLTFDDLARMAEAPLKYGTFAIYLLSRGIYSQKSPSDLPKGELKNKEIAEWLEEIAEEFLTLKDAKEEGE